MKRILLLTLFLILLTSCTPQEEEDFQIPFPDEISKCSILTIKFEKPEMINGRMEIESPYGLFNISPFKKEQGIAFRFTPEQRGIYYMDVFLRETRVGNMTFVVRGNDTCFVKETSGENLLGSDGDLLELSGMNLAWYAGDPSEYESYIYKMAKNNINLMRIVMAPWSLDLGWDSVNSPYAKGSTQENAYHLDAILETARKKDIYVILSFDIYGELRSKSDDPREKLWDIHPWNLKNGGFLDNPPDFFTHNESKEQYKQKLDLIVNRWAAYPNILAWEFWNEVDITDRYNKTAVYLWHDEMIDYLSKKDSYDHLITTSFANANNALDFWNSTDVDIITIHIYSDDALSEIEELISLHKPFNKPILVEEFGLTNNGKLGPTDANASLMKLFIERARQAGAIAVMPWWWDENIDRNNLYAVIGGGTVS